jgi:electron transport complex protein RnfD
MSQWPAADLHTSFAAQLHLIFGGARELDAVTMATALDTLRTGLHAADSTATVAGIFGSLPTFGTFGGKGWEWIATGYMLGGLWMIQQRIITWHIPVAFVGALGLTAGIFHFISPDRYAGAMFHIFAGGAMLGAFFIATDPVSGATTPKGKLIYAAAIAVIDWIIRTFGAYPDGVAFATLLMNIVAPLIDLNTQPPVFGHKGDRTEKP